MSKKTNKAAGQKRGRRTGGEGTIYERRRNGKVFFSAQVSVGSEPVLKEGLPVLDKQGQPVLKRVRHTLYGATRQEVRQKLLALVNKKESGELKRTIGDATTLGQFLDDWFETVAKVSTGPTTWQRYEQHLRLKIKPLPLSLVKLRDLDYTHVQAWVTELERIGSSPADRQKCLKMLRLALKTAVMRKFIPSNPATLVAAPAAPSPVHRTLTLEQARQLVATAEGEPYGAVAIVAIYSGLRLGELFGLHWADVDLDAGSISVRRSVREAKGKLDVKPPKTKAGNRRLALPGEAIVSLRREHQAAAARGWDQPDRPAFADAKGGYLRRANYHKRYKELLKKAGLPRIRFHDLRHTCATLLLNANVNPKVIQERLGHSNINITLGTYSHTATDAQKRAADVLDGLLGGEKNKDDKSKDG